MSRVPNKHGRDQELDWEISVQDKDKRMRPQATDKEKSVSTSLKIGIAGDDRRSAGPSGSRTDAGQYGYTQKYDSISRITSTLSNEESTPDAVSEKEMGNDCFKQKKFKEAIECYSRSIALAPTAVAYANRAMTYLKLRRFQAAEDDCTEALNLDDRYIKAYSRRATSRKELGKYKESSEDAEFAMRLEPQNQEIKKQYAEVKSLYQKELFQRASEALRSSTQDDETLEKSNLKVNGVQEVSFVPHSSQGTGRTAETSIQEDQIKPFMKVSSSQKIGVVGDDRKSAGPTVSRTDGGQYDSMSRITSTITNEESIPDAVSEKELGNAYFKQKKFKEAIECYSRSIALAPTAVAYTNRAMACLKLRRFQAAEDDCTKALNFDDRYIKAYSRRATARKELGKYKGSSEDAEFAMRLEPQNQEIKKQYAEVKPLYEKELLQRASGALRSFTQDEETTEKSNLKVNGVQEVSSVPHSSPETAGTSIQENQIKKFHRYSKNELKPSVQELANRAAALAMAEAAKNITPPTSAYQFEVSWRGLSGDHAQQARFLKAVSPSALPQIFKNALSAPILIDIIKCLATFFNEEMDLTIKYLENLTRVSRFDMIIMCLSSSDKADLVKIWDEQFCDKTISTKYVEVLNELRARYRAQ